MGILKPGDSIAIAVHVLPEKMGAIPIPQGQPCKHKFLVQSRVIDQGMEALPQLDIWASTTPDLLFQHKLRVEYPPTNEMEEFLNELPWFTPSVRERWKNPPIPENGMSPSLAVTLWPENELLIQGRRNEPTSTWMIVSNDGASPIAFKVYMSVRRRYTVRPSIGRVPEGRSVLLQIIYHPPDDTSIEGKVETDKLRVNSLLITPDIAHLSVPAIWARTTDTEEGNMLIQKLRVAYRSLEL